MSAISKKPILEIEPYPDEFEWEGFLISLGTLIKKRFKSGCVKCSAENLGWRHLSGYKVFAFNPNGSERQVAGSFLNSFMPDCEWGARVYSLNRGKGLYFSVSHHDVQGESYYFTPISFRTYERLR